MFSAFLLTGALGLCPTQSPHASPAVDAGPPAHDAGAVDAASTPRPAEPEPVVRLDDLEDAVRRKFDPSNVPPTVKRSEVDGIPTDKLGDEMPPMPAFAVPELVRNGKDYVGTRLVLKGLARRTCNVGCWLEVAEVPSSQEYVRILPGPGITMFSSSSPRRITAYGEFRRVKRSAAEVAQIDREAVQVGRAKHRTRAGEEWVLVAESLVIQWLD